ncbi:MAG: riboflavin biosynthesis protein RibD, partial [Acidobacteria bacterium]|nr:riboflavin biosynthesis protein RibD [Acidobacteriota bacterium]
RRELEKRGVSVLAFDGPDGRTDLAGVIAWLGERSYQSLLIEAGGRVNRAALASGAVDKIFFYYAPKILGDPGSLPLAGGCGRPMSAVRLEDVQVHPLSGGEFAVEASVVKCSPESSKS